MKKRNLIKLVSACMSCLLLTTPLCSAVNTIESNSKKENIKNTVLKVGGTIAGLVGLAALAGVLYNKFSSDINAKSNNNGTTTCKQIFDSSTAPSTFEENFLSFEGTSKPSRWFFADPLNNTHILMSRINFLKGHVRVVQESVVDKNFLRQIGSNGYTVVVNAANSSGVAGGGVCGTIFEEMGIGSTVPEVRDWKIKTNANEIGTGNVFIHPPYDLGKKVESVKYIMQTVWPNFGEYSLKNIGEAYEKLYEAYYNTIILSALKRTKNVVIPAISMGIFADGAKENPKDLGGKCSIVALTAIADALNTLECWGIQIQDFRVYLCDCRSKAAAISFFNKCKELLN